MTSFRRSVTVVVGRDGLDSDLALANCGPPPPAAACLAEAPLTSRLLKPPADRALLGESVAADAEASMALSRLIWSTMDSDGDTCKRSKNLRVKIINMVMLLTSTMVYLATFSQFPSVQQFPYVPNSIQSIPLIVSSVILPNRI